MAILHIAAILGSRLSWQLWPGRATCLLFWLVIATAQVRGFEWALIPAMAGLTLNATVTLANGGFMPGRSVQQGFSIWIHGDGRRLLALGDNYAGFSVGDFLIFAGLLCYVAHRTIL